MFGCLSHPPTLQTASLQLPHITQPSLYAELLVEVPIMDHSEALPDNLTIQGGGRGLGAGEGKVWTRYSDDLNPALKQLVLTPSHNAFFKIHCDNLKGSAHVND